MDLERKEAKLNTSDNQVSKPLLARVGAASGAVASVALFVAAGDGSQGYSASRAVVGLAALVLFLPFIAYIWSLLREAEGGNGWLSATALSAGIMAITLKVASGMAGIAMHSAHVRDGTQLHKVLDGMGGAATVMSLFPLALLLAVVAVLTSRSRVLPRWLGAGAGFTAAVLAVNGVFLTTESVPGLLLFVIWTLVASITLFRRARAESPYVGHAYSTASA